MSWGADDTSVRVALRIRPQLANEKIDMCRTCTHVPPGEAMVTLGKDKSFTYDYVFDTNSQQERIYESCIQPLIEGCFEGYNATVLAYGQTGAGKTYTMGTGFDVSISAEEQGVIPRAVEHLFRGIGERRKAALERGDPPPEFKINAQFMELYNEDINDLFDPSKEHGKKSHIKIHEDATGGIYTVGVTTRAVSSKEEIIQCLKMGALSRTTASTNMNAQSSRSHAIFTIHIKQQRVVRNNEPVGEEEKDDTDKETDTAALNDFETLTAKFHFVDLAGSERLKRTGATGDRQKEGISINCGLLALGNVISALGDPKKKGSHVPYRDSKLTRLLQDSLGGNSRTLMIACVSPSDRDFMETLNTLKYANRARNIKNKVSVNQDKTSKIIQELRGKVMELETELLEYRQGRRTIGEDGVECINDMFHENTMLQTENNQLRMRIKAIQETVESQAARISQLMTDQARWQIHQAGEDGEDQVGSMIQGYMREIEELRGKLIESESMVTHLQRRISNQGLSLSTSLSSRSPSHIALTGGLDTSDLTNQFGGGSPVSPIAEDTESIISMAKKDLQNLKHKKNRFRKRHNSERKYRRQGCVDRAVMTDSWMQSSDKENRSDGEEEQEEEGEKNGVGDESEEEEEDGDEEENQEEGEEEEEGSSESSSDEEDGDNLEEDLADISCEIAIKQKLIDELEVSQKKMQVLKYQYEEKLSNLQQKIQATQQERDKVLANMESVDHIAEEKAKKIKSEYERKLKNMQDEVKKLQAAKREHARLMRNNAQYEKQLKTLRHDLDEMKKTKVRLMKQMRDEQAKSRESENKRTRELAQLKKEQRRRDNVIQQLEREKKQRELVLKRKQEEVNSLRKQARPVSGKVGDSRKKTTTEPPPTNGHVDEKPELAPKPRPRTAPSARTAASSTKGSQSKPSSAIEKPGANRGSHIPAPTSTPRRVKHQRRQSSEKMAKMKWQSLEKRVGEVIARRQTINHMERDMERWLQEREKLGKRIERIKQKRNKAVEESKDPKVLQELQDQITVLTDNIDNVNDNIMESQNSIMQMSEEGDPVDITAVINSCSIEEARYLLEHFLNMVITKGMYAAQKETECKEREAKVHTLEHSYNMTQDLLQHLIQGQAEYDPELEEVLGNSMAAVAPSNSSSASSTRSASPVNEAEDKVTDLAEIGSRLAAMEAQQKKEKARRRTATPSDLLFADSSDSSSDIAACDIVKPSPTTLIPLAEQKDESSNQEKVEEVNAAKLMPPPPGPPSRPQVVPTKSTGGLRRSKSGSSLPSTQVNSAPDKRSTTPSMRRKTYTKPPPPISMSRTNSTSDTGSDMTITPPGSPTSQRLPDQNVFARLSAPSNSPHKLDKGSINPYNSRSGSRTSPLTCMHLAEGHTKAVLSVDATDDLLFSASKDRTVKVWNLVTGQEIMTLPGHPNNVVAVRYCSYTGLVFSVSTYFVKVWDIRASSAKCVKTLTSAGQLVTSTASSTTTRTLSMPAGETQINDIRLNRSGSRLYAAAGNTIRVWDLNKFQTIGKLTGGHSAAVMVMATEDQEHDTPIVVSGSKDHYIKQFHPNEFPRSYMEVFEVPENMTGSINAKYNLEPPHYDGIQSLAIMGDFLFSGSRDTCIKKWDLANQQLRQSISNAHKDWICALDFVPGRQMLLSGCRAGQLKVWQMEDCSLVGEVKGHDSPINAICSNSSHIFTASSDRNVRIWRPQSTLDGQISDNTDTNDEGHASI
ncbi:kinesin-like protein KIF21A isoform X4 [Branchiostoma floridae]|uniref:Kinesin-like protein KIF21A isoform X4 n=1 Tax=Branchiostoma floridae TaxID=7739 RepID=A0A9J7HM48_BRAFL|nr:kinesin-like protein KIF21A isoform X4 [Branchiostoma floridae]